MMGAEGAQSGQRGWAGERHLVKEDKERLV